MRKVGAPKIVRQEIQRKIRRFQVDRKRSGFIRNSIYLPGSKRIPAELYTLRIPNANSTQQTISRDHMPWF